MLKLSGLGLLFLVLMFPACTEDDTTGPGTGFDTPPTASFLGGTDFLTGDATVAGGSIFKVRLVGATGDSPLRTLEIFADGDRLDTDRIEINGSPAAANPILIVDEIEKEGFEYDISIVAQDDGTVNYEFVITDEEGLSDAASLNITVESTPVTITVESPANISAGPSELLEFGVMATVGSTPIASIAVYEDGDLIEDLNRLRYNGTTFATNPQDVPEADKQGFSADVILRVHANAGETKTYTFEVKDEAGNSATQDVTITTGTNLSGEFTAVVLNNAAGPNPDGGLDLYNGIAVSVNSDQAQIVDQGIDISLPNASNWLQQVAPSNGAQLALPDPNAPETFSYENVNSREGIVAAFESGTIVSESNELAEGDLLIVKNDNDYFLLEVTEITVTTNNNLDSYTFNVKQSIQ